MGILHFLDVGQGDCSIIQHPSGRVTVIDVCKARASNPLAEALARAMMAVPRPGPATTLLTGLGLADEPRSPGLGLGTTILTGATTRRAENIDPFTLAALLGDLPTPENPIRYMRDRGINDVFRFVLTHPDMDHMDGIRDFFSEFDPGNFWDTANTCEKTFDARSPYRVEDWRFYKGLRDRTHATTSNRLVLYSGARGSFYNAMGERGEPHDELYVLAPTLDLVAEANRTEDFNDASYVILYRSPAGRILFCGDAHDATWNHVLAHHLEAVRGVDLMIAPHHGRGSERDYRFLGAIRPKVTLFGVAPSEHLAYAAWRSRGLVYVTANTAGTIVVDASQPPMTVYVAREAYARERFPGTTFSPHFRAWPLFHIN